MGFLDYAGLERFWSGLKSILSIKVTGIGVSKVVSLTKEQYDALTDAEKNNGTLYITDEGIEPISDEEIESLFPDGEG